ncbi:MAG: DUF452 family protein [Pelagimonas sp.]|jgi:biotin synthesis protein BioG|nr:DUF452 family protein [Pelagimonas sp.]
MKRHWLGQTGQGELTLVFAGWALGAVPFQGLRSAGDVLVVEDFTTLDDPLPEIAGYERLRLLAFSFGVASAAHWMAQHGVEPAQKVSVAGTLHPADADRGIAPELVEATAAGLTDTSFANFCRRAGLPVAAPQIDIPARQAELRTIAARGSAPQTAFDRIWIPSRDRIIPGAAQNAAWADQGQVIRPVNAPHVPFRTGQSWDQWFA